MQLRSHLQAVDFCAAKTSKPDHPNDGLAIKYLTPSEPLYKMREADGDPLNVLNIFERRQHERRGRGTSTPAAGMAGDIFSPLKSDKSRKSPASSVDARDEDDEEAPVLTEKEESASEATKPQVAAAVSPVY